MGKENDTIPTVTKPYPTWVESVSVPSKFRMPQFRMFNGTGNPTQHAHYISRCEPVIIYPSAVRDGMLLQLFVQSLEEAAFTWYSSLPEGSTVKWQAMKQEFLRQFCNTQRRFGVPELIET